MQSGVPANVDNNGLKRQNIWFSESEAVPEPKRRREEFRRVKTTNKVPVTTTTVDPVKFGNLLG